MPTKRSRSRSRSLSPIPPPRASAQSEVILGHRAAQLQKVFSGALRATLSTNSYKNFSSCFPTPATYCPTALEGVWKQLNNRLEEECLKDFEKICAEKDVVGGLNELERLVEGAKVRREEAQQNGGGAHGQARGMHELNTQELYMAYATSGMVKAEKDLQRRLDAVQTTNKEKASRVQEQRREIEQLLKQMQEMIQDVEQAGKTWENDETKAEVEKQLKMSVQRDTMMSG